MLKDAWTIAIETLSWIELQKLSERLALAKTVKQLGISNPNAIRYAYGLVCETVRRKNQIDKFINSVLQPEIISDFRMGVQAFLRLYVYQTRIAKNWAAIDLEKAKSIAKLGRAILGWKTLRKVEPNLGFLITRQIAPILKAASDEERIGLQTFHPTWFVKYCFNLLGRSEAIAFLEGNIQPPSTCIRLNTLQASEKDVLEKVNGFPGQAILDHENQQFQLLVFPPCFSRHFGQLCQVIICRVSEQSIDSDGQYIRLSDFFALGVFGNHGLQVALGIADHIPPVVDDIRRIDEHVVYIRRIHLEGQAAEPISKLQHLESFCSASKISQKNGSITH